MTFAISAFQIYVMHFGHFFENRKNSGLTPGQNDDHVTRTWKMTQMTHLPGDPMTQFHVWLPVSWMTSCHHNCQWERIQYAQCSSSRAAIGWWRAACGSKAGGRSLISTIALSCGAHCASSVSSADVHFHSMPRGLKPSANFIKTWAYQLAQAYRIPESTHK